MKLLNNIHYYFSELVWRFRGFLYGQRYFAGRSNAVESDYEAYEIPPEEWFKKYSNDRNN
jgi:hypothetical protein